MIPRKTWALARRIRTLVSSHLADLASKASKPDNMVVVSKVVVSSVAKKERETWTMTRKIPAPERAEVRIVAARIAN
jgi:hypothetical protein